VVDHVDHLVGEFVLAVDEDRDEDEDSWYHGNEPEDALSSQRFCDTALFLSKRTGSSTASGIIPLSAMPVLKKMPARSR
jgi:hypothetical protein